MSIRCTAPVNIEITRLERPAIADYQDAFTVCQHTWPHLAVLNTVSRFSAFQTLGVELLVARRGGRTVGACFVLPERYFVTAYQPREFVWLFDFAALPEARSAGSSLLLKAMRWYPNLMVVGVTKKAAALYEALKWKRCDALWRCVHPLDVAGVLNAYPRSERSAAWGAIRAAAPLFKAVSLAIESAESHLGGSGCFVMSEQTKNSIDSARFRAAAEYLPSVSVGNGNGELLAIERAAIARILVDGIRGLSRLRAHVLIWKHMRARGAYLCEYVASSRRAALLGLLLGYVPLRMPLYYRDINGELESYITSLRARQFGFCSCEKIL